VTDVPMGPRPAAAQTTEQVGWLLIGGRMVSASVCKVCGAIIPTRLVGRHRAWHNKEK
jgi:hypothetical protein